MIRPDLRTIDTVDIDHIVIDASGNWTVPDPLLFGISIDAYIGIRGQDQGEDLFRFFVCSPEWLKRMAEQDRRCWYRHTLALDRWSHATLIAEVERICNRTEGETWKEVALKLNAFMHWEFAPY